MVLTYSGLITLRRSLLCVAIGAFLVVASVETARSAIVGNLEGPATVGSQISNIQGWVFTNTPGAELIQPFQVRIGGVDVMKVPCCGDRGDVQEQNPGAPLLTGFSGVYNWGLLGGGGDEVLVEVIVTDTAGGEKVLSTTVSAYSLTEAFSFVHHVGAAPNGLTDGPPRIGRCAVVNSLTSPTAGYAELYCEQLYSRRILPPPDAFVTNHCDAVTFSWDRASQGFKQTSDCTSAPRWRDLADGTAIDSRTGLMWELKTDDDSIHGVDRTFAFSVEPGEGESYVPDGAAHTVFLAELNRNSSTFGDEISGCFAGHCDWRIPTLEELAEIEPNQYPGCEDCPPIPGEVAAATYLTSTEASTDGSLGWTLHFGTGAKMGVGRFGGHRVRAVRGAKMVSDILL